MRKDTGFTLIELMIVIAIIATVLAITVPAYLTYIPNYRLNSAVEELQGLMQIARVKAIKEAASVCVSVNIGAETCTVFLDNGAGMGGTANNRKQDGTEATIKILTMPRGIDIYYAEFPDLEDNVVQFNTRGLPTSIGSIRLNNGPQGRYKAVVVNIAGRPAIRTSNNNGVTWN